MRERLRSRHHRRRKAEAVAESALAEVAAEASETQGTPLVTILYSKDRDLYRVPAIDKPCWLSVKTYELPAVQLQPDRIYLGPSIAADGKAWRKAFALTWRSIIAGASVAVPADDPMVLDYAAFSGPSPARLREREG